MPDRRRRQANVLVILHLVSFGLSGLNVGTGFPKRHGGNAVFVATRGFFGAVRQVNQRLRFGVVNTAQFHVFEKYAFGFFENHFTGV